MDSGELTAIRNNYMNDADVNAYMQKMIDSAPSYLQEIDKEKRLEAVEKFTEHLKVNYWQKKFQ